LGGSYLTFRLWDEFAKQERNALSVSHVVANNLTAAVAFEDKDEINRVIKSLENTDDFKSAIVLGPNGQFLAGAGDFASLTNSPLLNPNQIGVKRQWFELVVGQHVKENNHQLGTLFVHWGSVHIENGIILQVFATIFSFLAVGVLAVFASEIWKRVLTRPILALASIAENVERTQDYTLRLDPQTEDEIGYLTKTFNRMLAQIKTRDDQLENHKESLEQQVEDRTREILDKNKELEILIRESQAANIAKSYFLANMSHEIRTPLNGLLGMLDLLADTHLHPEQKEFVSLAKFSGRSLLQVVNDILDFSKIEANKIELCNVKVDIHNLISSVAKSFAERAAHKEIEFICSISSSVPKFITIDQDRLRQIIINLVGNAIKFTSVGEVVLEVDFQKQTESSGNIIISVMDTGIGIPLSKQSCIFEEFNQGDETTTRRYGGTGLGLAISKRLVGLMNGNISVESEFGIGSTFTINIPTDNCIIETDNKFDLEINKLLASANIVVVSNSKRLIKIYSSYLSVKDKPIPHFESLYAAKNNNFNSNSIDWIIIDDSSLKGLTEEEIRSSLEFFAQKNVKIILASSVLNLQKLSEISRAYQIIIAVKPLLKTEVLSILLKGQVSKKESNPDSQNIVENDVNKSVTKILVAEDNPVNQKLITVLLKKEGFDVTLVSNGMEVMSLLKQKEYWSGAKPFDLILMDIQMPELGGVLTTRLLREAESSLGFEHPIPIVALTAHAMDLHRQEYLEAGMNEHLTKPINRTELIQTIHRFTS
jgi:signal transduction histidine kinase